MFASLPSENITFSPINLINPQQKYDQLENQKNGFVIQNAMF